MGSALRNALVQAAHLIADAIEAAGEHRGAQSHKRPPKAKTAKRRRTRAPYVPDGPPLTPEARERAREALRKAGLPVPPR